MIAEVWEKTNIFFKGVGCEVTSELIEDGKIVWSECGSRGKKNQKNYTGKWFAWRSWNLW